MTRWLEAGALNGGPEPPGPHYQAEVGRWEAFLSGDSLKAQLANRYMSTGSWPISRLFGAARYAIRRTDDRFWSHSDALHAAYRRWAPIEAALFD